MILHPFGASCAVTKCTCKLCRAHACGSCPLSSDAAMLTTTKTVLSAPLPRVFEESANGKAVPVATPAHGPIGGGFQQDELGRISKETVSCPNLVPGHARSYISTAFVCPQLTSWCACGPVGTYAAESRAKVSMRGHVPVKSSTASILEVWCPECIAEMLHACCSQRSWKQRCWHP